MSGRKGEKLRHVDPNAQAARATSITKFRVFSRVRPFIPSELAEDGSTDSLRSVVEMTGNKTVLLDPRESYTPKSQFEFDDSLWSIPKGYKMRHTYKEQALTFASQLYLFDLVAKECATDALQGINSSILAYGQTGSGKTYTMMGSYDPAVVCGGEGAEGIIPRVCHDVFEKVEAKRQLKKSKEEGLQFSVEVTFVEIYMEKVRDLLDPQLRHHRGEAHMREARIRLDPTSGPFVEDVTKYKVKSWAECCKLLERGAAARKTCANAVHQQSSRSHAIFTLTILEQQTVPGKDKYTPPTIKTRSGRINLVDLAGSERGGFTDYVKESAKINTSLLSLRRVIDTLLERQQIAMEQMRAELENTYSTSFEKSLPSVPFRDSVLTWLLSDSMGGNARTTMVAALSPHEKNFGDTLATLQWSSKARGLVGVVKVNDTESAVQSGMARRASDIGVSLTSHRQTVDGLRNDLEQKQRMIDDLNNNNAVLMKQRLRSEDGAKRQATLGAVIAVQRFIRALRHKRRLRALHEELDFVLQETGEKQERNEGIAARVKEAEEAQAVQLKKNRTVESRLEGLRDRVRAFEAEEPQFNERFEAEKAKAAELEQRRATRGTAHGRAKEQNTQDVAIVRDGLRETQAKNERSKARLDGLRAETAAMTEDEKARIRERTATVKRDTEMLDLTTVEQLRQQKAALVKRRDELVAKLEEKKRKMEKK